MIKIGFSKRDITAPLGTELGGYAGYRPCTGVHDPLFCKVVVLEQEDVRYALVVLDLLCVDEPLYHRIAQEVAVLGISRERLLVCAIHSHASPVGVIPGEGVLAAINTGDIRDPGFMQYSRMVIQAAGDACREAVEELEIFQVRTARGAAPVIGTERHTGNIPETWLTALQFQTESGKNLILYSFPCHPTVLSAANLQVSADFVGGVEALLDTDMAVFVNGAAGDISTRFTRREATFDECARMAKIAAAGIRDLLQDAVYTAPTPLKGMHETLTLNVRQVESPEQAALQLEEATLRWQQAADRGEDAARLRILKSYVEGAGVNLDFSRALGSIRQLALPVTVFRFAGLTFATVPGELFSSLQPEGVLIFSYANGYFRYIAGKDAYDAGYYEALAAILARGEGERLIAGITDMICRLEK